MIAGTLRQNGRNPDEEHPWEAFASKSLDFQSIGSIMVSVCTWQNRDRGLHFVELVNNGQG